MSMLNAPRTSRRRQLREDQLATAAAASVGFFEENRNLVIGGAALIVIVIAAIALFSFMNVKKNQAAAEELGSILTAYELGRFQEAIDGNADNRGLVEIAGDYGSTTSGNLATFYAAEAYYQLGQYDRALEYFQRYDVSDDLIGASAVAGQAAAKEQLGEHAEAADLFMRAADTYESPATTPDYLLAAARNFTTVGDSEAAQAAYQRYLDEYEDLPNAPQVQMLMAQSEASSNS